jgi:hypothetical protein
MKTPTPIHGGTGQFLWTRQIGSLYDCHQLYSSIAMIDIEIKTLAMGQMLYRLCVATEKAAPLMREISGARSPLRVKPRST